ncbi:DUF6894 family protein [Mesorhizobium australafricanum]|uniref:DUF6894 family protein n=1 Tax=Mesorhizobium australafricanum TaxID=3072311 RepID=UPI003D31C87C
MPRFFFDLSDNEDVYHDARGVMLHDAESTKDRALEIIRRLLAKPPPPDWWVLPRRQRPPASADQN